MPSTQEYEKTTKTKRRSGRPAGRRQDRRGLLLLDAKCGLKAVIEELASRVYSR